MKDLNRYVTRKYAIDWHDIGIELGLERDELDIIENDHPLNSVTSFQKMLDSWLKLNSDDATWRTLEVALTNVNRVKLGLHPVDDVYGKDVYYIVLSDSKNLTIMIYSCSENFLIVSTILILKVVQGMTVAISYDH